MRYVSSPEILAFIRANPGATLREISAHFYPAETYLPCDRNFGCYNLSRKLHNLASHGEVVNTNPGKGKKGMWEAVA